MLRRVSGAISEKFILGMLPIEKEASALTESMELPAMFVAFPIPLLFSSPSSVSFLCFHLSFKSVIVGNPFNIAALQPLVHWKASTVRRSEVLQEMSQIKSRNLLVRCKLCGVQVIIAIFPLSTGVKRLVSPLYSSVPSDGLILNYPNLT